MISVLIDDFLLHRCYCYHLLYLLLSFYFSFLFLMALSLIRLGVYGGQF